MGAALAWFTTVALVLSFVLVLHQLGVDVTPALGHAMQGIERFLGHPLA
jgi:hypothetical protein